MVDKDIVHDEIKYTYWLTPHDRLDYKFLLNGGKVPAEPGSDVITGLGHEIELSNTTEPMFSYDRRMLRFGYYDVTAMDPTINSGYSDGINEVSDTFMFSYDNEGKVHKHKAPVQLDFSFRTELLSILSTILKSTVRSEAAAAARYELMQGIRGAIYTVSSGRFQDGIVARINSVFLNDFLSAFVKRNSDLLAVSEQYAVELLYDCHISTTVVPLYMMNTLFSDTALSRELLESSILFMYHPILDKFVFYDVGENDAMAIDTRSLEFSSDGTRYGIDMSGSDVKMVWSNIEKVSRFSSSKWYNMFGAQIENGKFPEVKIDPVEEKLNHTKHDIIRFDDLSVSGNCAQLISVKKEDVEAILKKTTGEFVGEYSFGTKTGDIYISEGSLWM